jgi:hypothetical protein
MCYFCSFLASLLFFSSGWCVGGLHFWFYSFLVSLLYWSSGRCVSRGDVVCGGNNASKKMILSPELFVQVRYKKDPDFFPFQFHVLPSDAVLSYLGLVSAFLLDDHCILNQCWLLSDFLVEPEFVKLKGIVSTVDNFLGRTVLANEIPALKDGKPLSLEVGPENVV